MTKELYAVIHLFQGIVHEIKIFPEWDKAREAADKKIVKEYGKLVEEQNTRDVDRTLVELAKLLQGTDTTIKTAAKYVQQVQASKEIIAKYEGLLNKEMSIARMKVEVLDHRYRSLSRRSHSNRSFHPGLRRRRRPSNLPSLL